MNTALKRIRIVCAVVFVAGIGGIIATSIVSNNNGGIIGIGLVTSIAAIVLLTATNKHIDAFDEVAAEQLERQVSALVASGANEDAVREAVRAAIDLGRSIS
jgi:hypothetical protein